MSEYRKARFEFPLRLLFAAAILARWSLHAADTDPLRLTRVVEPLAQAVALTVDPAKDDYSGSTRIDVRVNATTSSFRLHAYGPVISAAELRDAAGRTVRLSFATTEKDLGLITFTALAPVPPGGYALELAFTGTFRRDGLGLYKTVSQGDAYLFTQFESHYARRAFPCWDEPGFKIPWQLSVTLPAGLVVVANAAVAHESRADGMKTVHFGRTPPMPSYLVALAIGPLELVPVPGLAVPGRIVTPRGQAELAAEAARISPIILGRLEHYFGIPYPFSKLDQVAVPEFVFGGMENAGLITYRTTALLGDPGRISFSARRRMAGLVAHEMAHMWFGDLVTMAWWDDLWLNESFASWMAAKIVGQTNPEFRTELSELNGVHGAMRTDALPSVPPIRRRLLARDDPVQVVDELTYSKGKAILTMIESWIGPEKFRAAMRGYFEQHRWGNTTAEDLWRAFGLASGEDIPALLSPFMEKPGIPLVTVAVESDGRLRLTQRRFTNLGAEPAPGRWQIPIILRWSAAGRIRQERVLLRDESMLLDQPGLANADWIHPNAGEAGYYRWSLPPGLNARLARQASALTARERLGLLENASALLNAGQLAGDEFLAYITAFAGDPEPEVTQKVVAQLAMVRGLLVPDGQRERFSDFSLSLLRPVLMRLGMKPVADEPIHLAPLRAALISELGKEGRDAAVIAFARELTARYLVSPRDVDPALASVALGVSARHGDAALWDAFRAAFEQAKNPAVRDLLIDALGAVREPAVVERALDYALSGPLNSTEFMRIPFALAGHPGQRERVIDWVIQHFDELKNRASPQRIAGLISMAEGNDPVRFDKFREFLLDPLRTTQLAEKNILKATERMAQRTLLRERETEKVAAFLSGWSADAPTDR
ncbi:MAG: M1 family metallopeptidase [Opitutaceae bacterium]|nr:M1 family metallopeptidase [Opitutaceae bacterium]